MRLSLAIVLLLPLGGFAHDLGVEARLDAGQIRLEAFFDDDAPAKDAKVVVHDANKQTIAEGRTDSAGKWSFAAPPPGAYLIVVDAGDGHRVEERLTVPASPTGTPSTGRSRSEFTKPRWLGLGAGLLLIATVVIAVRRRRRVTPR